MPFGQKSIEWITLQGRIAMLAEFSCIHLQSIDEVYKFQIIYELYRNWLNSMIFNKMNDENNICYSFFFVFFCSDAANFNYVLIGWSSKKEIKILVVKLVVNLQNITGEVEFLIKSKCSQLSYKYYMHKLQNVNSYKIKLILFDFNSLQLSRTNQMAFMIKNDKINKSFISNNIYFLNENASPSSYKFYLIYRIINNQTMISKMSNCASLRLGMWFNNSYHVTPFSWCGTSQSVT